VTVESKRKIGIAWPMVMPADIDFEHLRPEVAVGWVTKPGAARNAM
jgi:hypothetical protein